MNNITYDSLLNEVEKCNKNEITKLDFEKWCNENIKVLTYIPIKYKYKIIKFIKEDFLKKYLNVDETFVKKDYDNIELQYEIYTRLTILFYYIDISIPSTYINDEMYDTIYNSYFLEYVMSKCSKDYENFIAQCDKTINLSFLIGVDLISDLLSNNNHVFAESVKMLEDLDKDKLDILKSINMYNNPTLSKLTK